LSAAADAGLAVPGDLAVTGYDDTFVAAIRQVSLTSVDPDTSGIGSIAAQFVLRRIEDPGRPVEEHLLPPRLVTRYSSGVPVMGLVAVASEREAANMSPEDFATAGHDAGCHISWSATRWLECPRLVGHVQDRIRAADLPHGLPTRPLTCSDGMKFAGERR
jgi:hypothetical protein